MKPWTTLLTAVALGTAAVVLLTARSWRTALRILLDLLTAVGLIRLSAAQTWTDLAAAAVVVALRQLVSTALLGSGHRTERPGGAKVLFGTGHRVDRPGGADGTSPGGPG
ncbi:hypothetical protein [Plantactinospora sp. B5E13]|uniref:hypothetical protein n=1 Tax=Plantactinospora sp. B5E13 TaxID=3153758 RepID=UPI00325D39B1